MTEGRCPECGAPFSFSPEFGPGELVAGRYEVAGCLAFGWTTGWIYLARDRNVKGRPVVLKPLLRSAGAEAVAAAVAERQFLAAIDHPGIVRVYDFIQHPDRRTGLMTGYIVMEYAGGKSLEQVLLDARRAGGPVPVAHALAYAIEVMPALGYLHDRGLQYTDFHLGHVIQLELPKLIDLDSVRHTHSDEPILAHSGYHAPELADEGPSPSSDLYAVGRALAVLTFDFTGYQTTFRYSLPDRVPLLEQQPSFARLLWRATHPDPGRRFGSASEMARQLTEVLREVLA
jgi:serine/threonine-protein kinase PknG